MKSMIESMVLLSMFIRILSIIDISLLSIIPGSSFILVVFAWLRLGSQQFEIHNLIMAAHGHSDLQPG